jgi:hypothetical protein
MFDALINTLFEFRWLAVVVLPVGLIALPVVLSMGDSLAWRQRRLRFFGIFYGMRHRETLWLASGLVRLLFVLSVFAFAARMTPALTIFYVLVTLLAMFLCLNPRRFLLDLVNAAVVYVALLVGNILMGYNYEVNGDPRYVVVYVLLAVFVVFYTAYHYLKSISDELQVKASKVSPTAHTNLIVQEEAPDA